MQARTGTNTENILALKGNLRLPSADVTAKDVTLGEALPVGLSLLHLYLAQTKTKPTAVFLSGRYCMATQNNKEQSLPFPPSGQALSSFGDLLDS